MSIKIEESKRSIEERNKLVLDNMKLVYSLVRDLRKRYYRIRQLSVEEAISAGITGLIRSAELWDSDKLAPRTNQAVKFCTYAGRAICQRIYREAAERVILSRVKGYVEIGRQNDRRSNPDEKVKQAVKPVRSLSTSYSNKERFGGSDDVLWDPPDKQPPIWEQANNNILGSEIEENLSKISEDYSNVLRLRYLEERDLGYIAKKIGRSIEAVRQKLIYAMNALRKVYGLKQKICIGCKKSIIENRQDTNYCDPCAERRSNKGKKYHRRRMELIRLKREGVSV